MTSATAWLKARASLLPNYSVELWDDGVEEAATAWLASPSAGHLFLSVVPTPPPPPPPPTEAAAAEGGGGDAAAAGGDGDGAAADDAAAAAPAAAEPEPAGPAFRLMVGSDELTLNIPSSTNLLYLYRGEAGEPITTGEVRAERGVAGCRRPPLPGKPRLRARRTARGIRRALRSERTHQHRTPIF